MLDDPAGSVDLDRHGETGPTVVLVPGSCSTGAAWRPVIASALGAFRCVTTSLPGYGGTAERRPAHDPAMSHETGAVEAVIRATGTPVHLVGHSFGGLVSLAVALAGRVRLASLAILEAPAANVLRDHGEPAHYGAFRKMTDTYLARFREGDEAAIAGMVDFYGGAGTFASWPDRVRAYAVRTTPVNILDWAVAYGHRLEAAEFARLDVPTLVVRGEESHPAARRANGLLAELIGHARLRDVEGAAHFMIATHPEIVGRMVAEHIRAAEEPRMEGVPDG